MTLRNAKWIALSCLSLTSIGIGIGGLSSAHAVLKPKPGMPVFRDLGGVRAFEFNLKVAEAFSQCEATFTANGVGSSPNSMPGPGCTIDLVGAPYSMERDIILTTPNVFGIGYYSTKEVRIDGFLSRPSKNRTLPQLYIKFTRNGTPPTLEDARQAWEEYAAKEPVFSMQFLRLEVPFSKGIRVDSYFY